MLKLKENLSDPKEENKVPESIDQRFFSFDYENDESVDAMIQNDPEGA